MPNCLEPQINLTREHKLKLRKRFEQSERISTHPIKAEAKRSRDLSLSIVHLTLNEKSLIKRSAFNSAHPHEAGEFRLYSLENYSDILTMRYLK